MHVFSPWRLHRSGDGKPPSFFRIVQGDAGLNTAAMLKSCLSAAESGQLGVMTMTLQHVVARSKARGLIGGSVAPDRATMLAVHGQLVLEGDVWLAAALRHFALSLPPLSEEERSVVCEGETVTPCGGLF